MNAALTSPLEMVQPLGDSSVAALATAHYDHVYALCRALYEDPALCLGLANQSFQDASGTPDLVVVCRNLAQRIARRGGMTLPIPSHNLGGNLAWLLKDVVGLRYGEIAAALDMDAERVKYEIAGMREALLAAVSDRAAA